MSDSKALILYFDRLSAVDILSREEKGELFEALLAYARDGRKTEFQNRAAEVAFYSLQSSIDKDMAKYEEICKRRSAAGKKAMAKRWADKQSITNDNNCYSVDNTCNQTQTQTQTQTHTQTQTDIIDTDVSLSPPQGDPAAGEHISGGEIDRPVNDTAVKPQQVVDMYNSICVSFPKVTVLSDKRRKAVNARLRSMGHSLEKFRLLFEKAERSDFLKGANKRDWQANFDWLMKDANMAKVLDGNYDNRPPSGSPHECPSDEDYRVSIIDLL